MNQRATMQNCGSQLRTGGKVGLPPEMPLQQAHECQHHVLAPMTGKDLDADRQACAASFDGDRRLLHFVAFDF